MSLLLLVVERRSGLSGGAGLFGYVGTILWFSQDLPQFGASSPQTEQSKLCGTNDIYSHTP